MERIPSSAWQRSALKRTPPRVSIWNRSDVRNAIFYLAYLIALIASACFIAAYADELPSDARPWHVGDYESAPNPADTWEYAP